MEQIGINDVLVRKDQIIIREMQFSDNDFSLLEKWLTDPDVLQYYEGCDNTFSRQKVIEKFGPKASGEENVVRCISEYNGFPIGYAQYYKVTEAGKIKYGITDLGNAFGIDLFIGEKQYWDQGIGTTIVIALLEYLFKVEEAYSVYIDPQTWNERAIRCYKKCGFSKIKLLPQNELHEGVMRDCWLMQISRDTFES